MKRKYKDGQTVLLKIRARNLCTRGDGSPPFLGKWKYRTIPATYWKKPFSCRLGHFHGNFGVDNADCGDSYVEVLDSIGFDGA